MEVSGGNKVKMVCEYPGCHNEKGNDYIRNENERFPGWEKEPIFLCDLHSLGHKKDYFSKLQNSPIFKKIDEDNRIK